MADYLTEAGALQGLGTSSQSLTGMQDQIGPSPTSLGRSGQTTSSGGANIPTGGSAYTLRTPQENALLAQRQGDLSRQYSNLNQSRNFHRNTQDRRLALQRQKDLDDYNRTKRAYELEAMRRNMRQSAMNGGALGGGRRTSGLFSRNYNPMGGLGNPGSYSPRLEVI